MGLGMVTPRIWSNSGLCSRRSCKGCGFGLALGRRGRLERRQLPGRRAACSPWLFGAAAAPDPPTAPADRRPGGFGSSALAASWPWSHVLYQEFAGGLDVLPGHIPNPVLPGGVEVRGARMKARRRLKTRSRANFGEPFIPGDGVRPTWIRPESGQTAMRRRLQAKDTADVGPRFFIFTRALRLGGPPGPAAVIGLDDLLNQGMADDVSLGEVDEGDILDPGEQLSGLDQSRGRLAAGRSG